jgi:copper(I)-binding protein
MLGLPILSIVCLSLLIACGSVQGASPTPVAQIGAIAIVDPWVRPAILLDGGTNSVVYLIIRNTGSTPDRLLGASSPIAQAIELHTSIDEGGQSQMRPIEGGLPIPAGGEVDFSPRGAHLMLIGISHELRQGDTVTITLRFEQAGEVVVQVPVRN